MELYRLRYFIALAQELNFTRAAARVHVTQQALSRSIAELERSVGAELVARRPRGCSLTNAGHLLLADAVAIVAQADEAARRHQRTTEPTAGHLDVLVWSSSPRIEGLLAEFSEAHPDVALTVGPVGGPHQMLGPLLGGQVDVIIGPGDFSQDADVASVHVEEQSRVAVVPRTSAWADAHALTTEDLLEATFGPRHPLEPPKWEGDWNLVPDRGEQPRRAEFDLSGVFTEQAWQVATHECVFTQAAPLMRETFGDTDALAVVPMPTARPVTVTATTVTRPRPEAIALMSLLSGD